MRRAFDESAVITRYMAGESAPSLAAEMATGSTCIYRILKRHGIQPKALGRVAGSPVRLTSDQVDEIVAANQAGVSMRQLGLRYGVHAVTIKNALERRGLKPKYRDRKPRLSMSGLGPPCGERHGNWKGGRIKMNGYDYVLLHPDHPFASMTTSGGYIAEHRLVMAGFLGRPLADNESVHHINGNRNDNRLENLQLRHGQHGNGVHYRCVDCGSTNVMSTTLT